MRLPTRPLVAAIAAALLAAPGAGVAAAPGPQTSGASALVVDARTGAVMHAVNAGRARPIASATKLMTALLTVERTEDLDAVVRAAPYSASPVESKIGLAAGERMTVRDLLTALLLESANDAAVTLAAHVAGSRDAFVREMNRRAVELGLNDTSYANPIGFDDPNNHSSARDLAALARRLLRNREFARIVDTPRATLTSGARTRTIDNRNRLVANHSFVSGVKTGHTQEAGYVLVGAGAARGARVISVTLGAPSEAARDADTLALLRWGLEQFSRRRVVAARRPLAKLDVRWRDDRAAVGAERPVTLLLRRGERTSTVVDAPEELKGPLDAGERVGWVYVRRDGRPVRRVALVTLNEVEGAGFIRRLVDGAGGLLTALALLGIVVAAMLVVGRRTKPR